MAGLLDSLLARGRQFYGDAGYDVPVEGGTETGAPSAFAPGTGFSGGLLQALYGQPLRRGQGGFGASGSLLGQLLGQRLAARGIDPNHFLRMLQGIQYLPQPNAAPIPSGYHGIGLQTILGSQTGGSTG